MEGDRPRRRSSRLKSNRLRRDAGTDPPLGERSTSSPPQFRFSRSTSGTGRSATAADTVPSGFGDDPHPYLYVSSDPGRAPSETSASASWSAPDDIRLPCPPASRSPPPPAPPQTWWWVSRRPEPVTSSLRAIGEQVEGEPGYDGADPAREPVQSSTKITITQSASFAKLRASGAVPWLERPQNCGGSDLRRHGPRGGRVGFTRL